MLTTTLEQLKAARACASRYKVLAKKLGSDYGNQTPIPMDYIAAQMGAWDAVWVLNRVLGQLALTILTTCDCIDAAKPTPETRAVVMSAQQGSKMVRHWIEQENKNGNALYDIQTTAYGFALPIRKGLGEKGFAGLRAEMLIKRLRNGSN